MATKRFSDSPIVFRPRRTQREKLAKMKEESGRPMSEHLRAALDGWFDINKTFTKGDEKNARRS